MPKTISGFSVVIPVTYRGCPENQTHDTCPLRNYIAKTKTAFNPTEDILYLPETSKNSWEQIRSDIEQMYEICTTCQKQNQQKTK